MDLQSIILDYWGTILIHFLCHRKFSPRFCCTWDVLHQVTWIHTRSSSICIHGSLSGIPQNLEVSLHMLLVQLLRLRRTILKFIWCKLQPMDISDDIIVHVEVCLVYLEQTLIIVFSLHLGELLVLDLAMLSFISLPYIVLHHSFQFLCLISFSEFISGW